MFHPVAGYSEFESKGRHSRMKIGMISIIRSDGYFRKNGTRKFLPTC